MILWFGSLSTGIILLTVLCMPSNVMSKNHQPLASTNIELKKEVFSILDTKCNACHQKQNPFMIFKEKNMEKRAAKINKLVFVDRKMPKGNAFKLTAEEYEKLQKWLFTQKIF